MAMDINKAIETGDKVGTFGNQGGPNLRGTLRTAITEASAKGKTVNLTDAMTVLKKAGFDMETVVEKKDDVGKVISSKTVSIEPKVKTALEDLKYAGFCLRAVTDADVREYYIDPKAPANTPAAPEGDDESEEDVE